ncbi:hypothetical protein SpCBS45565_g07710 [Spizellomyces sp. 'palustris']|nr:hypothetical protein SpCBS45565_g07710 [Spizellomyces sp. 'palustris']
MAELLDVFRTQPLPEPPKGWIPPWEQQEQPTQATQAGVQLLRPVMADPVVTGSSEVPSGSLTNNQEPGASTTASRPSPSPTSDVNGNAATTTQSSPSPPPTSSDSPPPTSSQPTRDSTPAPPPPSITTPPRTTQRVITTVIQDGPTQRTITSMVDVVVDPTPAPQTLISSTSPTATALPQSAAEPWMQTTGGIVGITVAAVLFFLAGVFAVGLFVDNRKKFRKRANEQDPFLPDGGGGGGPMESPTSTDTLLSARSRSPYGGPSPVPPVGLPGEGRPTMRRSPYYGSYDLQPVGMYATASIPYPAQPLVDVDLTVSTPQLGNGYAAVFPAYPVTTTGYVPYEPAMSPIQLASTGYDLSNSAQATEAVSQGWVGPDPVVTTRTDEEPSETMERRYEKHRSLYSAVGQTL